MKLRDEDLHRLRTPVDHVLAHDDDARHVIGPVFAGLEKDPAESAELRLGRIGLAHRKGVDRPGGERARDVGRRHLDHVDVAARHAVLDSVTSTTLAR